MTCASYHDHIQLKKTNFSGFHGGGGGRGGGALGNSHLKILEAIVYTSVNVLLKRLQNK